MTDEHPTIPGRLRGDGLALIEHGNELINLAEELYKRGQPSYQDRFYAELHRIALLPEVRVERNAKARKTEFYHEICPGPFLVLESWGDRGVWNAPAQSVWNEEEWVEAGTGALFLLVEQRLLQHGREVHGWEGPD